MTIGIAIPTYKGHLPYLERLLDSISLSTVMPDKVVIAASETETVPVAGRMYPFCVELYFSLAKRNTAQNTNMALSMLDTDILSVIGGDDMVHPQRNEFILRAFENPTINIVVHNFLQSDKIDAEFLDSKYEAIELYPDYIDALFPNIIYPTNKNLHQDFANGFVSFRRGIFRKYKYDESPDSEYIEDSLFNRKLVEDGYKISYIKNKLALYLKNPIRKP